MKKYFIARHFIDDLETLQDFDRGLERLLVLKESQEAKEFEFGFKLTVDERKVDSINLQQLQERRIKIPSMWQLYDPVNRGPGTSLRQVLFEPTFTDGLVVMADLDVFVPENPKDFVCISNLAEKVEQEEALTGMGSRNRKVRLGRYDTSSNMRSIHELWHSLTIGSKNLVIAGSKPNDLSQGYAAIGESTVGLWIMNRKHRKYAVLQYEIEEGTRNADLSGFAAEYFLSILSIKFGKRALGYVKTGQNKFKDIDEKEELKKTREMIYRETRELGKANALIRSDLKRTLDDEINVDKLSNFYKREEVCEVRKIMQRALQ